MENRKLVEKARKFIAPYRVTGAKKFRLEKFDPADTLGRSLRPPARTHPT